MMVLYCIYPVPTQVNISIHFNSVSHIILQNRGSTPWYLGVLWVSLWRLAQVGTTLTLDVDGDGCLSPGRGSRVENPAGVGASRVLILRDDGKHTDSQLPLPILHQCLEWWTTTTTTTTGELIRYSIWGIRWKFTEVRHCVFRYMAWNTIRPK